MKHKGIWILTAVLTVLPAAQAAENAPDAEMPSRMAEKPFRLDFNDLYLGLESEYEYRRVSTHVPRTKDTHQENQDLRFMELMGLSLDGHAVDPSLLSYTADLEFGLRQIWYQEEYTNDEYADWDSGCLTRYDISLDVLRDKPISFNVYARRHDDRLPRRFLPSLREQRNEAGASMLAVYGQMTTELRLDWYEIDRTGNRFVSDNEHLDMTRLQLDHRWDIAEDHKLRLFYDHERTENTYQGSLYDFENQRDELRLEHELAFGEDKQHRLDTYLRYNEEKGDFARDEIEFVPRLTLKHSDKFQTVYRYGWYRYEQSAMRVDQHKFDVSGLYTPNKEWRLSVDGFGLYERVDEDVQTLEYGGSVDAAWHKDTDHGELSMNAAFGYRRADTRGGANDRWVRNEAQVMVDDKPVILLEHRIRPESIVAHNFARTQYYVPGVDYVIIPVGDRMRVRRVRNGRINEGDVVYFDYRYATPTHSTVDAWRTDFLIEHQFDFGLRPYYAYEGRCEEVDTARQVWRYRDNTHRHRLGARFEKPRWHVGAEYELYDDTVLPYQAAHMTGTWNMLREPDHSLDLNGELSRYWYDDEFDQRKVWWLDVNVTDRVQLNRFFSLTGKAAYRWEDDSHEGTTNGLDLECGVQYVRGYLTVEFVVEYDLLDIEDDREDGFGAFLNVRRNLSHLLPERTTR